MTRVAWMTMAALALAGCDGGPNGEDDAGPDSSVPECTDLDGDGFGDSCEAGPDCDDDDARAGIASPGCACTTEGVEAGCRTVDPTDGEGGRMECALGRMTCRGGVWGTCEPTSAYPPLGEEWETEDGASRSPIIGGAEACSGTCDLGCLRYHACPSQRDLTRENASNMLYDAVNPPPALALEDPAEDGTFRVVFEAVCEGPFLWWGASLSSEPGPLETDDPRQVVLRVRTGDSREELQASSEEGWVTVLDCPRGACETPERQDDRLIREGGNLLAALPVAEAGRRFLEVELVLSAHGEADSPRVTSFDAWAFCTDAP